MTVYVLECDDGGDGQWWVVGVFDSATSAKKSVKGMSAHHWREDDVLGNQGRKWRGVHPKTHDEFFIGRYEVKS